MIIYPAGGGDQLQTEIATTSGTEHDFDIPSWVTKVTILLDGVSTNGTQDIIVQLGDSGGIETSGYTGKVQTMNSATSATPTSGIAVTSAAAAATTYVSTIVLRLQDAVNNVWLATIDSYSSSGFMARGTYEKTLTGGLTQLRLTSVSSPDTFDAGAFNISYSGDVDGNYSPDTAGVIKQVVNVQDGEYNSGTVVYVIDDSIPTYAEGNEFMTLAITPTNATNILKIEVVAQMTHSASGAHLFSSLFQDGTGTDPTIAMAWASKNGATNNAACISYTHYMTAGTTSSTTFNVLGGGSAAGTTYFNGSSAARKFGGTMASSITITEIDPSGVGGSTFWEKTGTDIEYVGGGKVTIPDWEAPMQENAQTGTTYAPVLTDADKMITLDNASAITVTIPANASVAFPVGTKLNFMQVGAGVPTIAITTDTLNVDATYTKVIAGQWSVATAWKKSATVWVIFGALVLA